MMTSKPQTTLHDVRYPGESGEYRRERASDPQRPEVIRLENRPDVAEFAFQQ